MFEWKECENVRIRRGEDYESIKKLMVRQEGASEDKVKDGMK